MSGPRARARALVVASSFTIALALGSSCKDPTAVEIDVRTNVAPPKVRGTAFYVGGDPFAVEALAGAGSPSALTSVIDAAGVVGTLVAVPEGGKDEGRLSVLVVTGVTAAPDQCKPPKFEGCVVGRRVLAYRSHERLRLPVLLEEACIDVPCDAVTTCHKGTCFASSVACAIGDTCEAPFPDEPTRADGGDGAAADGPLDGASGDGPSNDGSSPDAHGDGGGADGGGPDSGGGPDGGGTPGVVYCPPDPACVLPTTKCCMNAGAGSCTSTMAACLPPTLNITCDGPEDCNSGLHCCIDTLGTSCAATCLADKQLCNSNGDCSATKPSCTDTFAVYYKSCK